MGERKGTINSFQRQLIILISMLSFIVTVSIAGVIGFRMENVLAYHFKTLSMVCLAAIILLTLLFVFKIKDRKYLLLFFVILALSFLIPYDHQVFINDSPILTKFLSLKPDAEERVFKSIMVNYFEKYLKFAI